MKRSLENKVIAGVCSGLANEFGIDPIIVRITFLFAFITFGVGPLIYLLLWILMPTN